MVALLQRLGILSKPPASEAPKQVEQERDTLSPDQVAYLHELAEERRQAWMAHQRVA
jgi:hypothetical protein